ncbi:MAG: hypothetical protein JNG88_04995 [Phycisphaerales bacterium]|nr:hypothetical protein [Phycisphaerales bacterium]
MKSEDLANHPQPTKRSAPTAGAQVAEDRRTGQDRRTALDRRRGPGRRRTDYRRAAEEGHMNEEQLAFLVAVEEYKRLNHRPFPTLTEILDLVLYLGYRKVAPIGEFSLSKARQDQGDDAEDSEQGE